MYHIERYQRNPVVHFPEREWPNREIEKAPIWCSVDLRDGNQALVEPMVVEEKTEMFNLLLKLGFKEIEIGFPAASQIEFDFLRLLALRKMIPSDVHVQVLTQCREHLIHRTFEAIEGIPNPIVHIYNSTNTLQRDVGDFRLLDHRCVAALRLLRENQRFTKGLFTWVGFKKKEIPFQVQPRAAGKTTWSYLALLSLAVEGITSFTTAPLRLTTVLGLIVSALALCYMVVVLVDALVYGDPVAGYPTLMTVLLFLGGVQLLSLGIIGEYLGRVFTESKRRPCYLIDELDGEKFDNATLARRRYIDTGE